MSDFDEFKPYYALADKLMQAMAAGCNTMEGAGKDVKSVGQSLENSADKRKP